MINFPCKLHQCPSTFIKFEKTSIELGCPDCYLENKYFDSCEEIKIINIKKALANPEYLIQHFIQDKRILSFFSKIFSQQNEDYLKNVKKLKNDINELIKFLEELNNTLSKYENYLVGFRQKKIQEMSKVMKIEKNQLIDFEGFKNLCQNSNQANEQCFHSFLSKGLDAQFEELIINEAAIPAECRINQQTPQLLIIKEKFNQLFQSLDEVHEHLSPDFDTFQLLKPPSTLVPQPFLSNLIYRFEIETKQKILEIKKSGSFKLQSDGEKSRLNEALRSILRFVRDGDRQPTQPKQFPFIILIKQLMPENIFGACYLSNKQMQFCFSFTKNEFKKYSEIKEIHKNDDDFLVCYYFRLSHNLKFQNRNNEQGFIVKHFYGEPYAVASEIEIYEIVPK